MSAGDEPIFDSDAWEEAERRVQQRSPRPQYTPMGYGFFGAS